MVLDDVQRLEECCLSTILDNFDLFMMDYRSAEPRFSKLYEFLQRAYSDTLMAKLVEKNKLQDDHLYFVINPYIRKLHFKKSTVNPQIVIERLKVFGSAITSLEIFPAEWISYKIKEVLQLMPMLRTLTLQKANTGLRLGLRKSRLHGRNSFDEVLKQGARNCPHLEVVDAKCHYVTIDGLKHFCEDENGCTIDNMTLKELKISNANILPRDLAFLLEHCPSLKTLENNAVCEAICYRHQTAFLNNTIDSLPQYNLTALSLSGTISCLSTEDVLNLCAVVCPNVNTLVIYNMRTVEEVRACMKFKKLTDLRVIIDKTTRISMTHFLESRGCSLQRYEQLGGSISAVKVCECCPKLRQLRLGSLEFENISQFKEFSTIYNFPNLEDLCLSFVSFTQPCVVESVYFLISSSSNLKSLTFDYAEGLTGRIIKSISRCHCFRKTLRTLEIRFSDLSVHLARNILGCTPKLKTLVLFHTTIKEEEYIELNRLRHINTNHVNIIWRLR